MSKVKTPQEKKQQSLSRDRRNLYGECPTSSTKNISCGKHRNRRELRRVASRELLGLKGTPEDLPVDEAESQIRSKSLIAKRHGFKKIPDKPLAQAIAPEIEVAISAVE